MKNRSDVIDDIFNNNCIVYSIPTTFKNIKGGIVMLTILQCITTAILIGLLIVCVAVYRVLKEDK